MKVLVCIMAQVRTAEKTWPSFKRHVKDHLGADLALCIGDSVPRSAGEVITDSYTEDNGYFHEAKYVWRYKEPEHWETAFDEMTNGEWRHFIHFPGNWLGPTVTHKGSGGINTFFRWFLSKKLLEVQGYDQIIITRSDYYWIKPHPVLDLDHAWIPNGEFHGGVCDRHMVIPWSMTQDILSIGSKLTRELQAPMQAFYTSRPWGQSWMINNESYLFFMYCVFGLHTKLAFFQPKMFTVSVPSPNQVYVNSTHPSYPGLLIRYPDELDDAEREGPDVTWPWQIEHTHISRHGMFKGKVHKL